MKKKVREIVDDVRNANSEDELLDSFTDRYLDMSIAEQKSLDMDLNNLMMDLTLESITGITQDDELDYAQTRIKDVTPGVSKNKRNGVKSRSRQANRYLCSPKYEDLK